MAAAGILSIRAKRSPWGRLGSVLYTQAPTPHTPPLQAFFWPRLSAGRSQNSQTNLAMALPDLPPRALRAPHRWRMRRRRLPTTRPTSRASPGADLHPQKSVQFGPDGAPFPSKTSITRGPPVVAARSRWTPYYPTDSQLQVYDIYIIRRVLWTAHAWDVNICIWTSRKSVGHETNDRVMVHGEGTRADGRRSRS